MRALLRRLLGGGARAADPAAIEALVARGAARLGAGDAAGAARAWEEAARLGPGHAGVRRELARLHVSRGAFDAARARLREVLAIEPHAVGDRVALAWLLHAAGDVDGARAELETAIAAAPDHADAHYALGSMHLARGDAAAAARALATAAELAPGSHAAHNDLGLALRELDDADGAAAAFRRAAECDPSFHGAWVNLGNLLKDLRDLDGAVAAYEHALGLAPGDADALNNLANALKDRGDVRRAIECYRAAIDARPDFHQAHSNLLFALQYDPDTSPAQRFDEHREWAALHAPPPLRTRFDNVLDPDRRLRVGYVSADFRAHPIGFFVEPVLAAHDAGAVEVICYDDAPGADAINARLRAAGERAGHRWRDARGVSDEALAEAIVADRVDVLVDLAGHTSNNRMRCFAMRAAPVQASWIGYLDTTGLPTMDWLVADAVAVPEDDASRYTESIARLDGGFLCYGLPGDAPPPAAAPPSASGAAPTFGCFNNLAKVTEPTLDAWARVLAAAPGARLIVKNAALRDAATRERLVGALERRGVDRARVEARGASPRDGYLAEWSDVDVALDPFPFSGGTITCDALWMGVPVVTLAGESMAGRTSASVLSTLGLGDLIAADADGYVDRALALARDGARLATLRAGLRERFAATTLGDAARFTRGLEAAYRMMWRARCG